MTHTIHRIEPLTLQMWRLLTERPGRYTIEEFKRDLRASKVGIGRALAELEELRLISQEEEVTND